MGVRTVDGTRSSGGAVGVEHAATGPIQSGAPAKAPPSLLPEASSGVGNIGDVAAELGKVFIKNAAQKRQSETEQADAMARAEDAADARAIEAKKEQAEANFAAGMANGIGTMASGAMAVASGACLFNGWQGNAKEWDGLSKFTQGGGEVLNAVYKFAGDRAGIRAAQAENDSKISHRSYERFMKEADAASQSVVKMTELVKEIRQTQQQTEKAALLRA